MRIKFLAWQTTEGGSALILAAQNVTVEGGLCPIPAPEGCGLHVWDGVYEAHGVSGGWHRATRRDMEEFGVPLSEQVAGPGPCCAMRAKFQLGSVVADSRLPDPPNFLDFVTGWKENRAVMQVAFCPWCGSEIESAVRIV